MHNDVVTWNPVDWGGDAVLVTSLERVDHTKNLGGVAAGGCWVGEDQTDGLLWVDDEDWILLLVLVFFRHRFFRPYQSGS